MKERPILFSGPMVQALLNGTKTQTRRVIKPEPHAGMRRDSIVVNGYGGFTDGHGRPRPCPYGVPGDQLWVRESWQPLWATEYRPPFGMASPEGWALGYPATDGIQEYMTDGGLRDAMKPSIHMPRWASRISLEITEIRVQRLQDISEEDARAEGVAAYEPTIQGIVGILNEDHPGNHRANYKALWEQINGKGSWDANPWVWVVSFKILVAR